MSLDKLEQGIGSLAEGIDYLCAEIDRLRAINAQLLLCLKIVRVSVKGIFPDLAEQIQRTIDDIPEEQNK